MLEAMWSVEFQANGNDGGAGVVILETGRVFGGDSGFLYRGSYEVDGGRLKVKAHISKHYYGENVFGLPDDFTLVLEGDFKEDNMILSGHIEGRPDQTMVLKMKLQEVLP